MSERIPQLLVADMIESGNKILQYTKGLSYYDFAENALVRDAVMMNFTIIGEDATRLPDEIRGNYPDIEWNRIRGFKNRIVHDYFGLDDRTVWLTIESFLPDLIVKLQQLKL